MQEGRGDLAPADQQIVVCNEDQVWKELAIGWLSFLNTRAHRSNRSSCSPRRPAQRQQLLQGAALLRRAPSTAARPPAACLGPLSTQLARRPPPPTHPPIHTHTHTAAACLGPPAPPPAASLSTPSPGRAPGGADPQPTRCCAGARRCTAARVFRRCPARSCGRGGGEGRRPGWGGGAGSGRSQMRSRTSEHYGGAHAVPLTATGQPGAGRAGARGRGTLAHGRLFAEAAGSHRRHVDLWECQILLKTKAVRACSPERCIPKRRLQPAGPPAAEAAVGIQGARRGHQRGRQVLPVNQVSADGMAPHLHGAAWAQHERAGAQGGGQPLGCGAKASPRSVEFDEQGCM